MHNLWGDTYACLHPGWWNCGRRVCPRSTRRQQMLWLTPPSTATCSLASSKPCRLSSTWRRLPPGSGLLQNIHSSWSEHYLTHVTPCSIFTQMIDCIMSLLKCMNSLLILEASLRWHVACLCFFKPNEDRNVLEESAGFEAKGDITEPEVREPALLRDTVTSWTQSAAQNMETHNWIKNSHLKIHFTSNQWWIVT